MGNWLEYSRIWTCQAMSAGFPIWKVDFPSPAARSPQVAICEIQMGVAEWHVGRSKSQGPHGSNFDQMVDMWQSAGNRRCPPYPDQDTAYEGNHVVAQIWKYLRSKKWGETSTITFWCFLFGAFCNVAGPHQQSKPCHWYCQSRGWQPETQGGWRNEFWGVWSNNYKTSGSIQTIQIELHNISQLTSK